MFEEQAVPQNTPDLQVPAQILDDIEQEEIIEDKPKKVIPESDINKQIKSVQKKLNGKKEIPQLEKDELNTAALQSMIMNMMKGAGPKEEKVKPAEIPKPERKKSDGDKVYKKQMYQDMRNEIDLLKKVLYTQMLIQNKQESEKVAKKKAKKKKSVAKIQRSDPIPISRPAPSAKAEQLRKMLAGEL